MSTAEAEVPPLSAFLRPELPPAALRGLPGDVALALSEASGADPAAILVTFLALLGNAAGPQPHARFGGAEHPARLFAVLVGDAATGRKGTALGAVERLFAEGDPDWADGRVLFGLQSAEAMIDRVADEHSPDCRLMVVETEFGRLVETMARTGTLSAQLRNAWDGRTLQRATAKFTRRASRAHISLLAMITPEELLRHHRRLSQAGGLESRILYVFTAPLADVSPFAADPDHGHLAGRVRQVLEASREAVMSRTDPVSRYLLTLRGIQPRTELPVAEGDGQPCRNLAARPSPCRRMPHAPPRKKKGDDEGEPEHGPVPSKECTCGIYATTDLEVINGYLSRSAPVLGIVEMGGRVIPATQGYRAAYARLAVILLVDEALTEPHTVLRELADAYRVPAVIPHSVRAEDYRSLIQPTGVVMTDDEIARFFEENR